MSGFEVDGDMWAAAAWKRLAISMFLELERINGTTEINVSMDPGDHWPEMVLGLYPMSAKLSRSNAE